MRHIAIWSVTRTLFPALIGALVGALVVALIGNSGPPQDEWDETVAASVAQAVEQAVDQAVERAMSQSTAELASRMDASLDAQQQRIGEIFDQIAPSVVVIDAEGPQRVNDLGVAVTPAALATGFVLDDAGHIVTAAHVLEGMTRFMVILHDDRRLPAVSIGDDRPFSDVAVLRIETDEAIELPAPSFGNSQSIEAGETVLAIGNTLLGQAIALTVGVVSDPNTTFFRERYEQEHLIQTDAALNHGNSGGVLVDLDGSIIGMTAVIARETQDGNFVDGIGFALQIDRVIEVSRAIAADGYFPRPTFGVVQERLLTPSAAAQLDLDVRDGAFLIELDRNGAFARAGIRPGDVLRAVNGTPINAQTPYLNALARLEPRVPVLVRIHRQGEEYQLSIAPDLRAP